jgi:hypothetical protein
MLLEIKNTTREKSIFLGIRFLSYFGTYLYE